MARKKAIPVEETEQLQTTEAQESAGVHPTDDALPPEFSDAATTDAAMTGENPSELTEERADLPPEGAGMEIPEPTPDANAPDIPALDLSDVGQAEAEVFSAFSESARHDDGAAILEVMSVDISASAKPPDSEDTGAEAMDGRPEDPIPAEPPAIPPMPVTDAPRGETPAAPAIPEKSDRQKFYDLNFNRLDRDLTPEERQEWNSIYASYRGRSALSGVVVGVDPVRAQVRDQRTGKVTEETMFCAAVVPYRVKILIPATEMWEKGDERPDYVLKGIAGATIRFIITQVNREDGFVIGSRRLASRSQRYFFARRPNLNAVGTRLKCQMLSVGPRRCLVECHGHDIGLTQRDLRYTAIPNLSEVYHPGQELDCIVKSYDPETGRLEISVKETESNPFNGAAQRHPVGSRRLAVIAGKYGGGVFCNLPDGTVCMCSYSYQHEDSDFLAGDHVMLVVQRYEMEKQQMYGKILSKW